MPRATRAKAVMAIQQPTSTMAATEVPSALTAHRGGEHGHGHRCQQKRVLRAQRAAARRFGNAIEHEEAQQRRRGSGAHAQHERAQQHERIGRQRAQNSHAQQHAEHRQHVPCPTRQTRSERGIGERACQQAQRHGRQHVAQQLGTAAVREEHGQDEALERSHDHDDAEREQGGDRQHAVGAEQHADAGAQRANGRWHDAPAARSRRLRSQGHPIAPRPRSAGWWRWQALPRTRGRP